MMKGLIASRPVTLCDNDSATLDDLDFMVNCDQDSPPGVHANTEGCRLHELLLFGEVYPERRNGLEKNEAGRSEEIGCIVFVGSAKSFA